MAEDRQLQSSEDRAAAPTLSFWRDLDPLKSVLVCLLILAVTWYLLKELAAVLRPLLLAVLLAYVIIPLRAHFTQRIHSLASFIFLAVVAVLIPVGLVLVVFSSIIEVNQELPGLTANARAIIRDTMDYLNERAPRLAAELSGVGEAGERGSVFLRELATTTANLTAGFLLEAVTVGIYLVFILLEAHRLPQRVQSGFLGERAERIMAVIGSINVAMATYLKVKVKASLLLAIPVTLVLWAFGVKFALLWGIVTFFANFIPYLGSIVACALPIVTGFLQSDFGWQAVTVAIVLIGLHGLSAYLIEPSMTGKAINVSPLAILLALSFWYLCWGVVGMALAVPLTVMLKIVLENLAVTRPFAKLMGEE